MSNIPIPEQDWVALNIRLDELSKMQQEVHSQIVSLETKLTTISEEATVIDETTVTEEVEDEYDGPGNVFFVTASCNFTGEHPVLYWKKLEDADMKYEVRLDANFGDDTNLIVVTSGDNYTVKQWKIADGATDVFYLKALDTEGRYSREYDTITLTNTAPATPADVTVTAKKRANLLKWTKNTEVDMDHYEIYRNTSNSHTAETKIADTSKKNNTFRDTDIDDTTAYWYWIKAVDIFSGASDYSAVVTTTSTGLDTTDATAPTWPGGTTLTLTVEPKGLYKDKGKWTLTWSASAVDAGGNLAGYEVELYRVTATAGVQLYKIVGKNQLTAHGDGLVCKEGSTTIVYKARVRAFDRYENYSAYLDTAYTDDYTDNITPTIPVPDNVAFVAYDGTDAGIHWNNKDPWLVWTPLADESDLRDYEIRLVDSDWGTGGNNLIYRGKGSTYSVKDWQRHGITSPTAFYIKAYSKQGTWSAAAGTTGAYTIVTPSMIGFTPTVTEVKTRSVLVEFDDWASYGNDNVKEYEVWYSTNSAFDASSDDETAVLDWVGSAGRHVVKGLSRGVTYYFRIRPIGWLADGIQSSISSGVEVGEDQGLHIGVVDPTDRNIKIITEAMEGISVCDSATGWAVESGAGVTAALDTTDKVEGTGSIKVTIPAGVTAIVSFTFVAKDLQEYKYLKAYMKFYGRTLMPSCHFHFGESAYSDNESAHFQAPLNWQQVSYDISGIADASKNAVTEIGFTLPNPGSTTQYVWIDYCVADPGPSQVKVGIGTDVVDIYPKEYHGSYTGDGVDGKQIDIPRKGTPTYIEIQRANGTAAPCVYWMTSFGAGNSLTKGASGAFETNWVQAVGDCYFQVGDSTDVNADANTYYYTVQWED